MKSPVLAALENQREFHAQKLAALRNEELVAHEALRRLETTLTVQQNRLLKAITDAKEHQAHMLDVEGAIAREADRLKQISLYGSVVVVKA